MPARRAVLASLPELALGQADTAATGSGRAGKERSARPGDSRASGRG
ncbi:hypothetical protein [Streptomyces reticuliscabiei]|nr:hypothetical protein [Streptomyces reticuliscabiei]